MYNLATQITNLIISNRKISMPSFTQLCILLLISFTSHCQYCQTSYPLASSSCVFYFNQNQSCQSFSFVSCSWQECVNFYCSITSFKNSTSWDQCTYACCDSGTTYPRSWLSIQQCENYTTSKNGKTYVVVGIVFSSIIFLIIIMTCCYCCCAASSRSCLNGISACLCNIVTCRCLRNPSEINPHGNQVPQPFPSHQSFNEHPDSYSRPESWVFMDVQSLKVEAICSICFEVNPTIELACGHIFHDECITEWAKRKFNCPECRSHNITNINAYCRSCFTSYRRSTLNAYNHFKLKGQTCGRCNGKQHS